MQLIALDPPTATVTAPGEERWHCPHCFLPIAAAPADARVPAHHSRCPHCRLIVAAGRAMDAQRVTEEANSGVAASMIAGSARRDGGESRSEDEVFGALREAAEILGVRVSRLRLVDYEHLVQEGRCAMTVADVLSSQPGWKVACRAAARVSETTAA